MIKRATRGNDLGPPFHSEDTAVRMLSPRFLPLSLSLGVGLALGMAGCVQPDNNLPDTGSGGGAPPSGSGGTIYGTGGSPGSGGHGTGGSPGGSGGRGMGGIGGPGTGGTGTGGSSTDAGTGTGGMAGGTGGRAGTGGAATDAGSSPGVSGLPAPPGAGNVPKPSGTAGNITVLNWAGFKGAVTYSFDDDNDSQISNYSMLQAAGGQYTFFLWTGRTQATNAIWKQALKDGHEIGNHTKSHDSNNACTAADIQAGADFIMSTFSRPAQTFAAPNGSTCFKQPASTMFFINRGVSPASPVMPNGNSDPLNLNCYIPATGQQASVFQSNVDGARSAGGWVIYVVHGFSSSDGSYQPVDIGQMTTAIKYTKSLGDMWVGSMVNVGAYWLGQKAFTSAMTSMSGSDKTWTWTLPAHFPAGHYLRVTVPGGTVKQNGAEVPWDSHGYYEIALDAGSVTVSP